MKITAWKTVEVKCECDLETEQIVNEFAVRVDESAPNYWRRMLPALDCMTSALARISDETIAAVVKSARAEVHKRLVAQAARWEPCPKGGSK